MADAPNDLFARYYAEKLWELIPPIYRHEDGLADKPGVLRAFVEVLAAQAAILRRSNDRLWEDQLIDFCDDWAVPYLADLVGTRMLSPFDERRRADVANTIYYRRRAGTVAVLEGLVADITGFQGVVVEEFRRLVRFPHGLDPAPARTGRFTATPAHGLPDLRKPRGAQLAWSAWDEFHHLPDVRKNRGGLDGRYGVTRLAFHLFRLLAFPIDRAMPRLLAADANGNVRFTFDPSGRANPLFQRHSRPEAWRAAQEWELPAPMRCEVLANDAAKAVLLAGAPGSGFGDTWSVRVEEPVLGVLTPVPHALTVAGNLTAQVPNPPGKRLVIDAESGLGYFTAGTPPAGVRVSYHYGFSGGVGAGSYDRAGLPLVAPSEQLSGGGPIAAPPSAEHVQREIADGLTYGPIADLSIQRSLLLQTRNKRRPYLELSGDWTLSATRADSVLTLDGLWIGGPGPRTIHLAGLGFQKVTLAHVTLDPGGSTADGDAIGPISLLVDAPITELVIDESIVGPITVSANGLIEKLTLRSSIVHSTDPNQPLALSQPDGELDIRGCTVIGDVAAHRIEASELLCTGIITIDDVQAGCIRFSAFAEGSVVPRAYRSVELSDARSLFTSLRFGDPGYAQLSSRAPDSIARGGDNGTEMGAFNALLIPIKLDDLKAKVDELLPFGLIPLYLTET